MNNNNKGVISPFANRENMGMINVSDENHPVKEEVRRLCSNSYTIKVTFEEDKETSKVFAHIPGLITILCKFSIDGQVIAIGRSYSVFSRLNKYITRTVSNTLNGAFLSASNNAVKVIEAYRACSAAEEVDKPVIYEEEDLATDKQKGYLASLIEERIPFKERPKWIQELSNNLLTRMEASEKINNLLTNY